MRGVRAEHARSSGSSQPRHDGDVLERELAVRLVGVAERVAAGEAGVAVVFGGRADRLVDALHREVGERVGAELVGDLLDRPAVGDHLLARRHVDPVVARMADRRRADPQVDLGGAGLAQHPDDLAGRVAADDRVVDDDDPLAGDDLRQRVELQPQAALAQLLAGLDEGPGDVAVLDQAVVAGQARGAGDAGGSGIARVRDRDHEVGLDRGLAPEDLAHPARAPPAAPCPRAGCRGARSRCARRRSSPGASSGSPGGSRGRARSARPFRRAGPRAAARRR